MTFDIDRARADTPGCADGPDRRIHLNNCGSALPPGAVVEAVKAHLDLEARIGGYEAVEAEAARIEGVYGSLATLLNARPDEIAVVENATVAWDRAFRSVPLGPGDRVLTAMAEYASNYLAYLRVAEKTGAAIEVVPDDAAGQLDVAALERMIDDRVKLISITHVPTSSGLVNPAATVGRIARAAGIPYLLDACQSAGQMPLDVEELGCDMLSATGRKYLRGPRGTGFLYVRASMLDRLDPAFIDLHSAEWTGRDSYAFAPGARRFQTFEGFVAGKIGLGVAVDYALAWGLPAIRDRVTTLADGLRARLDAIPGVTVRDPGPVRCGIVSFTVEGQDPAAVKRAMAERGISISMSRPASTRLDMEARGLMGGTNRAGVHYYNSDAELDRLAESIAALVGGR